jgi:hypothetical protein
MLDSLSEAAFAGYGDNRLKPRKHDLFDQQLGIIWLFLNDQDSLFFALAELHYRTSRAIRSNNHALKEQKRAASAVAELSTGEQKSPTD